MRRSRTFVIVALAVIFAAGLWLALVARQFRRAELQAATDTAVGILLGREAYSSKEGSIELPVAGHPWGVGAQGRAFEDAVNRLPSGRYRYVKDVSGKFALRDAEGVVVSSGGVRSDWR